jgi:hypothetical protein
MQRVLTACALGLFAVVLGCGAPQITPEGSVSSGDTPEKVEHLLGRPNQRVVRQTPQLAVEIWSYERPNRLFSMDECGSFVEHKLNVAGHDVEGRQCKERARVVFSGGKVVAFEFAEGATY